MKATSTLADQSYVPQDEALPDFDLSAYDAFLAGASCTYLLVAAFCVFSGCECERRMAALPPHFAAYAPNQVPVILLGEVLENSHPVATAEKSEWDGGRPVQMWSVRVKVEQVLQGEVAGKDADIFYSPDRGMGDSAVARVLGNLYTGHSEIFFLQRDNGKLRTICDGWRSCIIWVRTGTHYKSRPELGPIEEVLVSVLLSRGDHTTDSQLPDAIYHPELQWGTLPFTKRFSD